MLVSRTPLRIVRITGLEYWMGKRNKLQSLTGLPQHWCCILVAADAWTQNSYQRLLFLARSLSCFQKKMHNNTVRSLATLVPYNFCQVCSPCNLVSVDFPWGKLLSCPRCLVEPVGICVRMDKTTSRNGDFNCFPLSATRSKLTASKSMASLEFQRKQALPPLILCAFVNTAGRERGRLPGWALLKLDRSASETFWKKERIVSRNKPGTVIAWIHKAMHKQESAPFAFKVGLSHNLFRSVSFGDWDWKIRKEVSHVQRWYSIQVCFRLPLRFPGINWILNESFDLLFIPWLNWGLRFTTAELFGRFRSFTWNVGRSDSFHTSELSHTSSFGIKESLE